MKTVKMIDVYNSVTALNVILEMKLPLKTSIKILGLVQELNNHLKSAEKIRLDLVEKYGKKDKSGTLIVPDSKKQLFIDDLNKILFETEVNISSELLEIDDFDQNFQMSPSQLSLINYLIK